MRVLHVVPTYVPAWRYGGPIRSVHGLCRALARRGDEVSVLTTGVDGPRDLAVDYERPVDVDGVQVSYCRTGIGRRLYRSPAMARRLEHLLPVHDVVHLHAVYLWPTLAAARRAEKAQVPYVVSPRGMLSPVLIRRRRPWLKRAWIAIHERRTLARASGLHVTCAREAEDLRALGLDLAPVFEVANGVDPPSPADRPSPALERAAQAGPFLLFIGRISREKGLDRLLEALVDVRGAPRAIVAGYDDVGEGRVLRALAERLGMADRIAWVGPVGEADKRYVLERALALVVPSYAESFAMVVLEAMAVGCPVVTTPGVGAGPHAEAAGAGVVVGESPRALGECLSALLGDPARLASMREKGPLAVRTRFTWDAVARDMRAVYDAVLSG